MHLQILIKIIPLYMTNSTYFHGNYNSFVYISK